MDSRSGGFDVFVRPFPNLNGGVWQVSNGGGGRSVWSRDGNESFYADSTTNSIWAVRIDTRGAAPAIGTRVVLFQRRDLLTAPAPAFDVSRAGRFLLVKRNVPESSQETRPSIVVVDRWIEELTRQMSGTGVR